MDSAWKTQMSPPLALLVVGALTPPEHEVALADENVARVRFDGTPDLVGITVKADTFHRAQEIAAGYRRRGVRVVFGGIHPTACPDECAPHADALVVGEAEDTWPVLLRDAAAGALRRVYRAERPVDLARSPAPRWDLLDARRYLFTNTLCIARGCPWACDFCYSSSPNVVRGHRRKPAENVLREIASLGTDHVMFIDDNFIGDPAAARDLVARLAPLGLTWHCAVSADVGRHGDLIERMAAAGCRSLFIGFETVNERSLLACRKRQNRAEEFDGLIGRIHAAGMMVNASVVFGFDEDGPEVFDETVGWLERNRVATMTAHILTPYPGTRLHRRLLAEGRIIDGDLRRYNTSCAVFRPARMSAAELEAGYRRAYARFYSWAGILRRLPLDRRQTVAFLEFNLVYRKFGRITSRLGRWAGMRPMAELARRWAYPAARPAAMAEPAAGELAPSQTGLGACT